MGAFFFYGMPCHERAGTQCTSYVLLESRGLQLDSWYESFC